MKRLKLDDSPYDAPGLDASQPGGAARQRVRPKDAASLILVRAGREVLMGQRAAGHVFMPDKWVFPGGRVDPGDARLPAASELAPEVCAQLAAYGVRRAPRAFAQAAVRETREEAGLAVGGPEGPPLAEFALICRAITPPYRSRRFDARFFLAEAERVLPDDQPRPGDELLHTRWFSLDEAEALDLPSITRFVLSEVRARLAGEARRPAFMRWARGAHRLERL